MILRWRLQVVKSSKGKATDRFGVNRRRRSPRIKGFNTKRFPSTPLGAGYDTKEGGGYPLDDQENGVCEWLETAKARLPTVRSYW
jgi:hypothetical protein